MANPDQVTRGDWVYYHGSMTDKHGYMRVEGTHFPYEAIDVNDTVRYYLQYGPGSSEFLVNVRPASFTLVEDDDV